VGGIRKHTGSLTEARSILPSGRASASGSVLRRRSTREEWWTASSDGGDGEGIKERPSASASLRQGDNECGEKVCHRGRAGHSQSDLAASEGPSSCWAVEGEDGSTRLEPRRTTEPKDPHGQHSAAKHHGDFEGKRRSQEQMEGVGIQSAPACNGNKSDRSEREGEEGDEWVHLGMGEGC